MDKDGICDEGDKDRDGDRLWDDPDNCPGQYNPKQADHDKDDLRNVCEDDANISAGGGGCNGHGHAWGIALLLVRSGLLLPMGC